MVKLSVILTDNNGNYTLSKYNKGQDEYITANTDGRIVIRFIPEDKSWNSSYQIIITQKNIFQVRYWFKLFYQKMQRNNLFEYDDFGKIVRILTDEKDEIMINLAMRGVIRLRPTTTSDKHGTIYPGVNITINNENNQVDLSIEEFEGLYDLMINLNIPQLSLLLLQTYLTMSTNIVDVRAEVGVKSSTKIDSKSINEIWENNKDGVKFPPKKVEQPKTLDELF